MSAVYKLDQTCQSDLLLYRYQNVKNIKTLLKEAKEGTLDCALLNPAVIYDPFQIVIAANKAVVSFKNNTMFTRNIYSEIIFNLSPSKNIMKSLSTFGIDGKIDFPDSGIDVLVAIVRKHDSKTEPEKILSIIDGEIYSGDDLVELRNVEYIKKIYNINGEKLLNKIVTICATK